jgi:hypothetical protein
MWQFDDMLALLEKLGWLVRLKLLLAVLPSEGSVCVMAYSVPVVRDLVHIHVLYVLPCVSV